MQNLIGSWRGHEMLGIVGSGTGVVATRVGAEFQMGDKHGGFARQLGGPLSAPPARVPTMAGLATSGGLLALQELRPSGSGRRRSVARGQAILDGLDELGAALLDDTDPGELVSRLRSRLDSLREPADDAGLEAILDAIDLRAEVELAKLERRAGEDAAAG